MVVATKLRKNAVITTDTPGFVVNRILAKVLGEAMHAVDTGTPFEVVDGSVKPFGLPMTSGTSSSGTPRARSRATTRKPSRSSLAVPRR
jgi:3-hydroxyacyl-CoA dehydrogenase